MIIRPLTESDLSFIAAEKTNFHDGWNMEMLVSSYKTGRFFGFIAVEKNSPIGFITYSVALPTADVESVYVKEGQRKKGVALALLKAAEDEAKSKGVEKLFLEVRESNIPAKNLYRKFGFNKISERKKYYGDESAEVFIKEI